MPVPRGQRPYCTVAFPLNDSRPRLRAHSNLIPCDGSPYPSCMHSFSDLRGLPAVPASSGWVQRGERWDLWWSGRIVASIVPHAVLGFQVYLDARRMSPAKVVHAVNARQARRYAERWCAARLCPRLRLRDAVACLVGAAPSAGAARPPPLTREQRQQARRLAEAGTGEVARIKQALAPRQPARPLGQLTGQAWSVPGRTPTALASATPKAPHARSWPLR